MKITQITQVTQDAIHQLRLQGQQMLDVAETLEHLNTFADGYQPKPKRKMSRAARLLISKAQKKRWAKARKVK